MPIGDVSPLPLPPAPESRESAVAPIDPPIIVEGRVAVDVKVPALRSREVIKGRWGDLGVEFDRWLIHLYKITLLLK